MSSPTRAGASRAADTNLLAKDVVLYTTTVNGSVGHSYRAGGFMDPFETSVPLDGDTSDYPFHHLNITLGALASTGGGVRSGKPGPDCSWSS